MKSSHLRLALTVAALTIVFLPATAVRGEDAEIAGLVDKIFDGNISKEHANVVMEDSARKQFWAFHAARYLDVVELRIYMIPYASAVPEDVRSFLDAGDDDAAFESLLANMNLSLGAMFIADVGLDGIHEEPVAVGQGKMRDSFHREQFADHAAADVAYREWLARAITLKERAS